MKYKCKNDTKCIDCNKKDIRKITKALAIILSFMAIELWGHYKSNSLSLLADALHLLVDISGFLVSIITLSISKKKATKTMPWGYDRIEVIGAIGSVIFIWMALIYLIIESVQRYMYPSKVEGRTFFWIAVLGLFFNLGCAWVLHESHSKIQNLNVRAAYVHVIGDVIQSIGVIVASVIVYLNPSMVIADIGCTIFFGCLVFYSTYGIVKDGIRILGEGAPKEIDEEEIRKFILNEKCVITIIDLKIWSLSVTKHALIVKILVDHIIIHEYETLLIKIKEFLKDKFDKNTTTIEIQTLGTCESSAGILINDSL